MSCAPILVANAVHVSRTAGSLFLTNSLNLLTKGCQVYMLFNTWGVVLNFSIENVPHPPQNFPIFSERDQISLQNSLKYVGFSFRSRSFIFYRSVRLCGNYLSLSIKNTGRFLLIIECLCLSVLEFISTERVLIILFGNANLPESCIFVSVLPKRSPFYRSPSNGVNSHWF